MSDPNRLFFRQYIVFLRYGWSENVVQKVMLLAKYLGSHIRVYFTEILFTKYAKFTVLLEDSFAVSILEGTILVLT